METTTEIKRTVIEQIKYIFEPETVAVIGAANTFGKWGFDLFRTAFSSSPSIRAYPVNRNAPEVQGVKAYPTLKDPPEPVDFAVIVVPYSEVLEAVQQCVDTGVKAALIISAGLAETGSEGAKLQEQIVRTARKGEVRLVGPNCAGNFNTANGFCTLRQGLQVRKGRVGVVSQSGSPIFNKLKENGVLMYPTAERAAKALAHLLEYTRYLNHS